MSQPKNRPNRRKRFYNESGIETTEKASTVIDKAISSIPQHLQHQFQPDSSLTNPGQWSDELEPEIASMIDEAIDKNGNIFRSPKDSRIKLSKKLLQAIARDVSRYSMSIEDAASANGINRDTLYEWIKRIEGLADAFKRARSLNQKSGMRTLLNHRELSERGLMFVLERRHREAFAQKNEISVNGTVNHLHITPDQARQIEDSRRLFEERQKQLNGAQDVECKVIEDKK